MQLMNESNLLVEEYFEEVDNLWVVEMIDVAVTRLEMCEMEDNN